MARFMIPVNCLSWRKYATHVLWYAAAAVALYAGGTSGQPPSYPPPMPAPAPPPEDGAPSSAAVASSIPAVYLSVYSALSALVLSRVLT